MGDLEDMLNQASQAAQGMPVIVNGKDLMAMVFPEPAWLVENLIPAGMTILAGPPKKGKSWLALELALAVCSGGVFLGRKVQNGRVLFCALEDSPRRFKDRMQKQGWTAAALENLDVIFGRDFQRLFRGQNGLAAFTAFIAAGGYSLVVVDTISRAFHIRDWNDAAQVTAVLSPLQEVTSESGVNLLCLDHHKKRNGFDPNPIEDILGSVSKSGVADTVLGLYKESGKPGAKLAVVGRDVEECVLDLRFDAFAGCWVETARNDDLTDTQKETLRTIERLGGFATLTDLVNATNRNRGTLHRELVNLQDKGLVTYDGKHWKITLKATQATDAKDATDATE